MEKMSRTQESLNNKKDKAINNIKENINYIYILLITIVNIFLSLFTVSDGTVALLYPKTMLAWVLLIGQMVLQTVIGVLILNSFRRQGVKLGHKVIENIHKEYMEIITKEPKITPRSLKQYMSTEAIKNTISKSVIFMALSLFVGSVAITGSINNLVGLIMNIVLAMSFGLKALLEAEDFVINELSLWYKKRIKEIKKTEEVENGLQRNKEFRFSKPSTDRI